MVTQVPLHVAETWDSHLSLHLVRQAFDPDGHPLPQKTFPSLGLTHLQLPAWCSYLSASPVQSTLPSTPPTTQPHVLLFCVHLHSLDGLS